MAENIEESLQEEGFAGMIRPLKYWCRQVVRDVKTRNMAADIRQALQAHFKLSSPPRLKRRGVREFSSNYLVYDGSELLGILHFEDPNRKRPALPADRPQVVIPNTRERIEHEWRCYEAGAALRLTPRPLWRSDRAIMCEYLPYEPLQQTIIKHADKAWDYLSPAARAVTKLHAAGITHMDCATQNMLKDPAGNHYFIDFEYKPAKFMSAAAQRVYDYLRMIETTWKFLPPEQQKNFGPWLQYVASCLDDEMRVVDVSLLAPSLPRIMAEPVFGGEIKKLFKWSGR